MGVSDQQSRLFIFFGARPISKVILDIQRYYATHEMGHTIGELSSGGRLIASQENPSLHSDVRCDFEMASTFVSDTKRVLLPYQTTTEKESLSGTLK